MSVSVCRIEARIVRKLTCPSSTQWDSHRAGCIYAITRSTAMTRPSGTSLLYVPPHSLFRPFWLVRAPGRGEGGEVLTLACTVWHTALWHIGPDPLPDPADPHMPTRRTCGTSGNLLQLRTIAPRPGAVLPRRRASGRVHGVERGSAGPQCRARWNGQGGPWAQGTREPRGRHV